MRLRLHPAPCHQLLLVRPPVFGMSWRLPRLLSRRLLLPSVGSVGSSLGTQKEAAAVAAASRSRNRLKANKPIRQRQMQ